MSTRFRKWFIRATKINNTSNGVYEYDFEKIYTDLKCRYDVVVHVVVKDLKSIKNLNLWQLKT